MNIKQQVDRGILFQMNVLAGQLKTAYQILKEVDGVEPPMIDNIMVQQTWKENQVTQFECKKIGCIVKTYNN